MQRTPITLAAFLLFCSTLFAQTPEGWQDVFDKGVAALTAGEYDEGIAALKQCLTLQPDEPTCAYNIACGYSLKNEPDPGFEWLGKAVDWGYVREQSDIDTTANGDTDLANLRKDARFAPLMQRMKEVLVVLLAAIEKEWKEPLIVRPEGYERMTDLGALIVLHDFGSSKKAVAESYWKAVAAELHLILVIPSGEVLAGQTLAQGMAWFSDFRAFQSRYWEAEKTIEPAVAVVKKMESVAADRVFIAGQGQGGTVAFNAAIRAPRLYAGVLAVDAPILQSLTEQYFPNAISAGVQIRVLASTETMFQVAKDQIVPMANQMRTLLTQANLPNRVTTYTPAVDKPNLRRDLVIETLREMLPAPNAAPVQPGAEK